MAFAGAKFGSRSYLVYPHTPSCGFKSGMYPGKSSATSDGMAAAVNQAPAGPVINPSEEKVRALLADFRQAT